MTRLRTLCLSDQFTGSAFPAAFGDTLRRLISFPDRLLPLGDVICRFNPAFGQGMSVAAQEVGVLKRLIEARTLDADPLKGLAQSFFAAIQDFLAAPWAVAESDFIYEKTRGHRPNDFHQRLRFNVALQRVAAEDATVHQIMSEVTHLVKPIQCSARSADRQPGDGPDGCLGLTIGNSNGGAGIRCYVRMWPVTSVPGLVERAVIGVKRTTPKIEGSSAGRSAKS